MIKDYGYRSPVLESHNFFSGSLPKVVVNPSGDWREYCPLYEPQFTGFDTNDCTIFGLENTTQIYIKKVFDLAVNYSERFISNGMNRNNLEGADPHSVHEWVRKNGMISQELLPMVMTLEEYRTPRPLSQSLKDEGKKWGYALQHEYVFANNPSKEIRIALLTEHLRYSPVGLSVTAWRKDGELYVDDGRPNTHWCVLVHIDPDGTMYIFDSYDFIVNGVSTALIKKLHPDHHIEVAKRIFLSPVSEEAQIPWIKKLVSWVLSQFGLPQTQIEIPQPVPTPQPFKQDLLTEFCLAIRDYEGKPGDLNYKNNNPGNIRSRSGQFLRFPTYEEGFQYLKDYVIRACTGKHALYKPEMTILQFFQVYAPTADKNDPNKYASWVASRIKVFPSTRIKDLVV